MPLPRIVARLNRRYTNRFIEPIVRRTSGFAVIGHTGRRSGLPYRTPVYAFECDESVVVALTYGPSSDWAQNVLAGGGQLIRNERAGQIASSSVVGRNLAWPHLPRLVRFWLRILQVHDFLLVDVRDVTEAVGPQSP